MPFKSKQQSRFMYSQHPEIAKKWTKEMKASTGSEHPIKPLRKRVKGSKSTPAKTRRQAAKYSQPKKAVKSSRKKGGK